MDREGGDPRLLRKPEPRSAPAPEGAAGRALPDLSQGKKRGDVEIAARRGDQGLQRALARAVGGPAIDSGFGGPAKGKSQSHGKDETPGLRRAEVCNGGCSVGREGLRGHVFSLSILIRSRSAARWAALYVAQVCHGFLFRR